MQHVSSAAEGPPGDPARPFLLAEDEAVALAEIAGAFAKALPEQRRGPFQALARHAEAGSLPGEFVPEVERVCALALETGQARKLGRAEAERLLAGLYRRTPGGRALAAATADVNAMLTHVSGHTLVSARITSRMPGRYQLDLVVDGVDIVIALEPEGLEVRSLQTG